MPFAVSLLQDIRPLQEDMCDFYSSGSGYAYDSYYTEVTDSCLNTVYLAWFCVKYLQYLLPITYTSQMSLASFKSQRFPSSVHFCASCVQGSTVNHDV